MQRREVILMQTEINYQQLGQRVREKRKAMNVQQKDMAIAIGTATNHLSDIERGRKRRPPPLQYRETVPIRKAGERGLYPRRERPA